MAKGIFKSEGYQSPITFAFGEMTSKFIKQDEEAVLKAVMRCNVGRQGRAFEGTEVRSQPIRQGL